MEDDISTLRTAIRMYAQESETAVEANASCMYATYQVSLGSFQINKISIRHWKKNTIRDVLST